MPHQISLPYFASPFVWQKCPPLCMPHQISLLYFALPFLWQKCAPLCMSHKSDQSALQFTLSFLWLGCTPFFVLLLMPCVFLQFHKCWHCLCCRNKSCCSWYHRVNLLMTTGRLRKSKYLHCRVVKREDDMNVINSTWTFKRRKSLGGEVWGTRHRGALHCILYNVSCSVLCTVTKIVQSSGGSVKLGWWHLWLV